MRNQGERLARIEKKEEDMETMMMRLQQRLEDVATKLECGPRTEAVAQLPTPPTEQHTQDGAPHGARPRMAAAAQATPAPPHRTSRAVPTPAITPADPTTPTDHITPAAPTKHVRGAGGAQNEWYKCNDCAYEARSLKRLDNHVATHHTRPHHASKTVDTFLLVGDSTLGSLRGKVRQLEKALGGGATLITPGLTNPKDDRAYCSTPDWPEARYPMNSQLVIMEELLGERPYKGLIVLAPTNDISNLENVSNQEDQVNLAGRSAMNTVRQAEDALRSSPSLETVLILEQQTRVDKLTGLAEHSAAQMRDAVKKSEFAARIKIGSNRSEMVETEKQKQDVFGAPSKKNDGIHMRGEKGPQFLADTIVAAIREAGLADRDFRRRPGAGGRRPDRGPQADYQGWRKVGRGGHPSTSPKAQEPRTWAEVTANPTINQEN